MISWGLGLAKDILGCCHEWEAQDIVGTIFDAWNF